MLHIARGKGCRKRAPHGKQRQVEQHKAQHQGPYRAGRVQAMGVCAMSALSIASESPIRLSLSAIPAATRKGTNSAKLTSATPSCLSRRPISRRAALLAQVMFLRGASTHR